MASLGDKINVYDLYSKPTSVLTHKTTAWNSLKEAKQTHLLSLGRQKNWSLSHFKSEIGWGCKWFVVCYYGFHKKEWKTKEQGFIRSNNIGVYKNIFTGYSLDPTKAPISIPQNFGQALSTIKIQPFHDGKYTTRFFIPDSTSGLSNYFVIYTQFQKKISTPDKNLGLVEIISKSKFKNLDHLIDFWIEKNNYYKKLDYDYQSLASQEKFLFHPHYGSISDELAPPFQSIYSSDPSHNLALKFHFNPFKNAMPLIEAWQIDPELKFKNKIIENPEPGLILIHHPQLGKYTIDSQNFLIPR